jgi:hypothetical protein
MEIAFLFLPAVIVGVQYLLDLRNSSDMDEEPCMTPGAC